MKRLKAFFLTAGLIGSAGVAGADPLQAPTVPSIPAPILKGEKLAPMEPGSGITPATVHQRGMAEKLHLPRVLTPAGSTIQHEPVANAPALAAAPQAMPNYPIAPTTMPQTGNCAVPCEKSRSRSGECWDKFKTWICFSPEKLRLGLTPTPYHTPYVMQFDCAAGCTGGNCGKTAACGPRVSNCNSPSCRGTAGGCLGTAVNNDPGIAGYRFAAPENKAVASPATQPVVTTSYKPAAIVPYKVPTKP